MYYNATKACKASIEEELHKIGLKKYIVKIWVKWLGMKIQDNMVTCIIMT